MNQYASRKPYIPSDREIVQELSDGFTKLGGVLSIIGLVHKPTGYLGQAFNTLGYVTNPDKTFYDELSNAMGNAMDLHNAKK